MESQSASARRFKREVTFGQWTFWSAKTTHEYAYWRGVESIFMSESIFNLQSQLEYSAGMCGHGWRIRHVGAALVPRKATLGSGPRGSVKAARIEIYRFPEIPTDL